MAALIKLSQHVLCDELVRAVDFQDKGLFFEVHFFLFLVYFSQIVLLICMNKINNKK